jgi:hypothetical protein
LLGLETRKSHAKKSEQGAVGIPAQVAYIFRQTSLVWGDTLQLLQIQMVFNAARHRTLHTSETSVYYKTTRRYIRARCQENLKSHSDEQIGTG